MIVYLSSPLLLELGTNFSQVKTPDERLSFLAVSPVNYSDSGKVRVDHEKVQVVVIIAFYVNKQLRSS